MIHCNQYLRVVRMMVRGRDLARLVLVLVEAVSVLVLGVRTAAVTSNCSHYNCDP